MGAELWSSAFLPPMYMYQGAYIPNSEKDPLKMVQNIRNKSLSLAEQREQLDLVDKLNRSYFSQIAHQAELDSHIQSMEVAFRLQTQAPQALNIHHQSKA